MERSAFVDRLTQRIHIADGAMGTQLHELGAAWDGSFENMNRTAPEHVFEIHRRYVAVGADILETNTFQANRMSLALKGLEAYVEDINTAGVRLAREAAGPDTLVAGSIGPVSAKAVEDELSFDEISEIYSEQATLLANAGVDAFVLETFTDIDVLTTALMAVRKVVGDQAVICEMAFSEFDRTGRDSGDVAVQHMRRLAAHGADVVGGNCGSGPTGLLPYIRRMCESTEMPISALPNASYPQYVDGRYVFRSTAEYIAERAVDLADAGANIVGGCCGTGPGHIQLIAERLKARAPAVRVAVSRPSPPVELYERIEQRPTGFFDEIHDRSIIMVEIDPPKGLDYASVIEAARALKIAGVDAMTSADNSLASIRMSTFVMSHLVQRETDLPVIVHCACRDRNLIGQQSELLGASALGLKYMLPITGDPASMANIGASSVYDTNSIGLIKLIHQLNQGKNLAGASIQRPTDFVIGCALDPSGHKIDGQLRRLRKKVDAGAQYVLTQPLYDADRIRELYERTSAEFPDTPVFCGIMPLASRRNAEFLHNEVPGIRIPDEIIERMRGVTDEESKDEGIAIAAELTEVALEAGAPGIYIVPPFNKYDYALKLIPVIKAWDRTRRASVR
jgi:methionine synthase / methylenetetrahydrofolate reductase(NADPH)